MIKKFLILLLGIIPVQLCNAQEMIELEKIVVTPYKTAVSASLNPSSTDVISVEELNSKGVFSLIDAIKDIPSLSYATAGGVK